MALRLSTKRKLADSLDELEKLTRLLLETLINKDDDSNPHIILQLLFEKHKQYEELRIEATAQMKLQKKIDLLVENNLKLDGVIREFQEQMKKCESLLRTVLFYGRQKLTNIQHAIKNPLEPGEVVAFSHRLSASNSLISPENWQPGDPRRPYPTDEEMRRGFLGHLNDSGAFRGSVVGALQESLVPMPLPTFQRNPTGASSSTGPAAVPVSSVFVTGTPSNTPSLPGTSQFTPPTGLSPLPGSNMHPSGAYGGPPASSTASSLMLPGVNLVTSPTLSASQQQGRGSSTLHSLLAAGATAVPTPSAQPYGTSLTANRTGTKRPATTSSSQRRSGGAETFLSSHATPGTGGTAEVMSSGADTPSPISSASDD